jgi:hypothetical protein
VCVGGVRVRVHPGILDLTASEHSLHAQALANEDSAPKPGEGTRIVVTEATSDGDKKKSSCCAGG